MPDELRDAIIKTEPLKSLRTADLKAAERLACIARVNLDTQVGGHPQRRHKPKRELSQSEL